jgi:hypothetical protein
MAIERPQECPSWQALQWSSAELRRTTSVNQPLDIPNAPYLPGLYRMIWHGLDDWQKLPKQISVKASVKVQNPVLSYSTITPPIVLTIGRTTSIRKRIRQHFGTNRNNNRALMRIRNLCPDLDLSSLLDLILKNVRIEWVTIDNWVDRCLLEKSGVISEIPIFDLDAEH